MVKFLGTKPGGVAKVTQVQEGDVPPMDYRLRARLRARQRENQRFDALYRGEWQGSYPSQSEADLALNGQLLKITDGDKNLTDVLFRASGLYRNKWERENYRNRTLALAANGTGSAEWPDPIKIQSELPPVERFSEDLLPESFRPFVRDQTERMQVPMDFPATALVNCLAGVVNRRASIQPKMNDTGWIEVPNLWGAIVASPGLLKSPVIQMVTRAAIDIQNDWRQEHEAAMVRYEQNLEEWNLRNEAWKTEYKACLRRGKRAPERPQPKPEKPKLRRLVVNDATFEALHETMSANPAGVLLIRDEIVGFLAGLDRAGHETERAFCLEAWNGKNPYTVDRIGRGTIHVPACCMSLMGGIQPGRLRSYLVDALKDGPANDGLIQRFQLSVWPDTTPAWKYVDRPLNATIARRVARVFQNLVQLDAETPARFRFSSPAQDFFIKWLGSLEAKVRSDELHPAVISHLSKYRKLMPSLALVFELADRASSEGFDGSTLADSENFVNLEHARQAAAWCKYLESHARRIYSCVVTPQIRAAGDAAEKIKQRKIGADGSFTCRDVYLKGWSGLDTPESVAAALEVLKDAGWVREVGGESGSRGGRPSDRYEVNPKVWE